MTVEKLKLVRDTLLQELKKDLDLTFLVQTEDPPTHIQPSQPVHPSGEHLSVPIERREDSYGKQ